jgi:hypothetical protein
MSKMFYHISSIEAVEHIATNGITADEEGYIYMLDTNSLEIVDTVAVNQLFLEQYYLYEIDPTGITAELEPDEVAEFTASHHLRIKQAALESRFIKNMGSQSSDLARVQKYTDDEWRKYLETTN